MSFHTQEQTSTRPMPQILTPEEFVQLIEACTPSHKDELLNKHVAACHRAILWLFYDTGICTSELINLCLEDVDFTQGVMTIKGTGDNHRCIAFGHNCLHHVLQYLAEHRPHLAAITTPKHPDTDHLFLSEKGQPMNARDISLFLASLQKRAGITGKLLRPSIFRDTFAVRFLEMSHNVIHLRYFLGQVSLKKIKEYVQMSNINSGNPKLIKASDKPTPGNQPEPRPQRRRGFQFKK
jgi:site-specific recombinase XerD